ncbi:hypothetical protein DPEC_G00302920 [Dallia pectoralis]|uniref:Uncharacterized protein n=1 Tax=Dallia pectoralis TaxID=75939 RepID=A0ACC2FH38_DALPE|nr:hypothetical protein DPEC_G00302920 [Dallia pectoralis]
MEATGGSWRIKQDVSGQTTFVIVKGRQISDLGQGLSDYSDWASALELAVTRLSSECRQMAYKIDDLESRSRRCNLRVVGIPERLEGADPVAFMSGFFTEVLSDSLAPSLMKLDRAHCLGPHPTGSPSNRERE